MMNARLRPLERQLLSDVVSKWRPELLPLLDVIGHVKLTLEQQEELRQVVAMELVDTGLSQDDEPNPRGLLLENLIDRLGHI